MYDIEKAEFLKFNAEFHKKNTGQKNYEFTPSTSYLEILVPPQDDQINKVAKINAHLWQFVADLPEEIYVLRFLVLLRDSIKEFMTSNDITYSTL